MGWPQVSMRTLYRRVRLAAIWRRPKLTARGDPDHEHVAAAIVARLIDLPRQSVDNVPVVAVRGREGRQPGLVRPCRPRCA
jgi:hypothetical protein